MTFSPSNLVHFRMTSIIECKGACILSFRRWHARTLFRYTRTYVCARTIFGVLRSNTPHYLRMPTCRHASRPFKAYLLV